METVRVGLALPDPPFNGMPGSSGLDIDLMTAIADHLAVEVVFLPYQGSGAYGITDALNDGAYDCVVGATVTTGRESAAQFLPPYLISGQALAVDTNRLPAVTSIDDLKGLTVGVQRGETGQPLAERLVAHGKAAAVRVYDDRGLASAVTDLTDGGCDGLLGLAPVLAELTKAVPGVQVVQRGLSTEQIAIAVSAADQRLYSRLAVAQAELEDDGTLQRIRRRWLGNPYADQNTAVH